MRIPAAALGRCSRRHGPPPRTLNAVLSNGVADDYAKARAMLADSARFNLGTPQRSTSPTCPLELLHPRHASRFAIRLAGEERVARQEDDRAGARGERLSDDHPDL
jgi:chloramphenicol 3-O-phosphotransferase